MSSKLNRAARRKVNRMSTADFERATDETIAKFFGIPCMVLAQKYGWNAEQINEFISHIDDLYTEPHDAEYYRKWLWDNVGITLKSVR